MALVCAAEARAQSKEIDGPSRPVAPEVITRATSGQATVRAIKYHGGVALKDLGTEDLSAVETGFANLRRHLDNVRNVYGIPCVVAINRFPTDTDAEVGELVFETTHDYGDVAVRLFFYACSLIGTPRPLLGQEMRWVPRADLPLLGFPEADTELITRLTTSAGR